MSEVKIQRFMHHSLGGYFVNVKTNPLPSDYVEYSDYEKLKAQLEKAEAVISFYGDENSWYLQKDPVTGSEIRRSIAFFDTESFGFQDTPESRNILKVFGGKRAREYFKEKEQV